MLLYYVQRFSERDSKSISGIKINEKELRLSQYADDTQIFLDGTEKSLKETLGWSGGAMVLGKLPVPGRPTYLD